MAAVPKEQTDEEQKLQEEQNLRTVQSIMGTNSYTPGASVTQAQEKLAQAQSNKPGAYSSRWQSQMDSVLNDILNRKDFSYDVNADPLYQQYRDQYLRNGQTAMRDTMGQAAQLTGGYGNSYAQQAGQQAYSGYVQGLNDKIPELYSLAMQAYNNQYNDLVNRYNVLGAAEGTEYGRYQDSLNAYNAELDRLQNQYNTERSYDYGQYRDSIADMQQQWANAWEMYKKGKKTPEILAILGLPEQNASRGGGGGSGGSGRGPGSSSYNRIEGAVLGAYRNGDSGLANNIFRSAVKSGAVSKQQAHAINDKAYEAAKAALKNKK